MKIAASAILIVALTACQCLASDICSLGRETLRLPDAGQAAFYKDNIEGKVVEGMGSVVTSWQRGSNKTYVVSIDCGNDVVVNVAGLDEVKNLKAGQQVYFKGTCVSYGSRRHIYTKETYMVFELEKGSLGEEKHE